MSSKSLSDRIPDLLCSNEMHLDEPISDNITIDGYVCIRKESNANNPKEIWKTINELMNRKTNEPIINEITFDNNKVRDPHKIASRLNEHFTSVGTKLNSKLPRTSFERGTFEEYIKCAHTTFDLKSTNRKRYQNF